MAKGVNKVILLGNVGRDPEIKATAGGLTVANLSIATADRKKGNGGEWVDHTEWHSLVALGKTAEIIRDYVKKGSQLYIEGKLQTRSWEDRESGEKKYRTEILVNELTMLGGKKDENSNSAGRSSAQRASSQGYYDEPAGGITDDDIPF